MTMLNESLVKITKGGTLAILGTAAGLVLGFICRLLIARIGTEAEYGIYSLAFIVLQILATIGTLGFQQGLPRSIALARGKNDLTKAGTLVTASVQLGLLTSILLGILLFFLSDILATSLFHDSSLDTPLKILALAVPFLTLTNVLSSVFRGFENIKPTIYFANIGRNIPFIVMLLTIFALNLSFTNVFWALAASMSLTLTVFFVYSCKRLSLAVKFSSPAIATPSSRELVIFSIPLIGIIILDLVTGWTDTLMLGEMMSSADVGHYSAALPLGQFIAAPIKALAAIYVPVITGLFSRNWMNEIRQNYVTLTRWLSLIMLPIFMILFLHTETVLTFLFGASYDVAALALKILSVGFIFGIFVGPNGATLIAFGETRFLLYNTLAAVILNVGLNITLIPNFGIEGAAIATAGTLIFRNIISSWKLYSVSRAHPLKKALIKPLLVMLLPSITIGLMVETFWECNWYMLPILLSTYYVLGGLALLVTKSLEPQDFKILLAINAKSGQPIKRVKEGLKKFIRFIHGTSE